MIEINLKPQKKEVTLDNVAGMDLTLLNIKFIIFGLLLLFLPDLVIVDVWNEEKIAIENQITAENNQFKKMATELSKLQNLQKQAEAFEEQEKKLAKKLEVVKEIINKRSNPFRVFKYIAENIPEDVWLEDIKLNGNDMTFNGKSRSFSSIGTFIDNLKNSIFFSKDIKYDQPSIDKSQPTSSGPRHESFVIKTQVVRFE